MPKVIYLTGAPASGKSTAMRELQRHLPDLAVFEYGARLTEMIAHRRGGVTSQDDLRAKSAAIITKADVDELDQVLIDFVHDNRAARHVLIDSHPVTKERYGFRITAFSEIMLKNLNPTEIWVLFASAAATIARIEKASGGRPTPTPFESDLHTHLQASVAATYGIVNGSAVYLFDTGRATESYITEMVDRLAGTA